MIYYRNARGRLQTFTALNPAAPAYVEPASKYSVIEAAGRWLPLIASGVAVASAVAFLLAAAITALLFRGWGLSAFQYATPTDLALTAADIIIILSPVVLALAVPALLGMFSGFKNKISINIVTTLSAGFVMGFAFYAKIISPGDVITSIKWLIGSLILSIILCVFFRSKIRRFSNVFIIGLLVTSFCAFFLAAADIKKKRLSWGTGPKSFVQEGVDNCPRARILWVGTRAVVVECTPAGKRVILNPQSMTIGGTAPEDQLKGLRANATKRRVVPILPRLKHTEPVG